MTRSSEPRINGRRLTLREAAVMSELEDYAKDRRGQWFSSSHVYPASGHNRQANQNARVLLATLARHGVPQERGIEVWETYYGLWFARSPAEPMRQSLIEALKLWDSHAEGKCHKWSPKPLEVAG